MAALGLDLKHRSFSTQERAASVVQLNRRSLETAALGLLDDVLNGASVGQVAMVSSFGAESAVLLDLVSRVRLSTPVLFLDTLMLFEETLQYQRQLADYLGLTNVECITPDAGDLASRDPASKLHESDTNGCCHLRKVQPLEKALEPFDAWITGRKRFQGDARTTLKIFEADGEASRIKINPLAFWEPGDLKSYLERRKLPRHPLVSRGYPSIGCAPCTSPVAEGEDARSGRWRGQGKSECGIHIQDGRVVRSGQRG